MSSPKANDEKTRQRAELIVQVRSGLMSAKEAARRLGISRKTYYKWEKRALSAMVEALSNRTGGRPGKAADEEKEELRERVEEMEARERVRAQVERIRELLKGSETSAQKK